MAKVQNLKILITKLKITKNISIGQIGHLHLMHIIECTFMLQKIEKCNKYITSLLYFMDQKINIFKNKSNLLFMFIHSI